MSVNAKSLNVNLSQKEKDELVYLNKEANSLNKIRNYKNNPLNMTLRENYDLWRKLTNDTLHDLVNLSSNFSIKYSKYFDENNTKREIFTGVFIFIREFIDIVTNKMRIIYNGFTLILVSFMLYIILISS